MCFWRRSNRQRIGNISNINTNIYNVGDWYSIYYIVGIEITQNNKTTITFIHFINKTCNNYFTFKITLFCHILSVFYYKVYNYKLIK